MRSPVESADPHGIVELLRAGSRSATAQVVAFIDEHREVFGVEATCRMPREHGVGIAPSTYRAAKNLE
jgi:hypothetical protein